MRCLIFFLVAIVLISCGPHNNVKEVQSRVPLNKTVQAMLDSFIRHSDTVYTKPYKRTDFVWATYYADTVNKTICQVMKDSSQQTRQIIVSKNNIRKFFIQYYDNGQLIDSVVLDEYGQYDGPSVSYYINGVKRSEGTYLHGLHTGKWNNYNEDGKLVSTDEYDNNGAIINK